MHIGAAARYNNYTFHLALYAAHISANSPSEKAEVTGFREKMLARSLDFVCRADTDTSERHLERHRAVAGRLRAQTRDGAIFIKKSPLRLRRAQDAAVTRVTPTNGSANARGSQ
jgi:hypothetical protein